MTTFATCLRQPAFLACRRIPAIRLAMIALATSWAGARAADAPASASAPSLTPATATATAPVPTSQPRFIDPTHTLATCVPANARLYLELRHLDDMMRAPLGIEVAYAFSGMFSSPAMDSAPAGGSALRQTLAAAVGMEKAEAAQLLLGGRLAITADGWSGLSDAVLLAWPTDPAALEMELSAARTAESESAKVRHYRLRLGYELACDGRTAVVGRPQKKGSLFARTLDVVEKGADALAATADFRERVSVLPADAQVVIYMGKSAPESRGVQNPLMTWWPDNWPWLETAAVGLVLRPEAVNVEVSGLLASQGLELGGGDAPVDCLRQLPDSTLLAWSQSIDFVQGYRQMAGSNAAHDGWWPIDLLLDEELDRGVIEEQLLSHLVGDSVFVVDQVATKPEDSKETAQPLLLPSFALIVETDDPDAVSGALLQAAQQLVNRLNAQASQGDELLALQQAPASAGGPMIFTVPVGQRFSRSTQCDFLRAAEISGTVADRWLILATSSAHVRRILDARRGAMPTLVSAALEGVRQRLDQRGGRLRGVMVAQPRAIGLVIDSWLQHVEAHHPQLLADEWWEKLLRRHRASGQQLGILARTKDGMAEVIDVSPGGPARDHLRPGDLITAVDGIRIDAEQPLKSLREYLAGRARPDRVTLLIRRGEASQEIVIPMEDGSGANMHPLQFLARVASFCRLFSSASFVAWQREPGAVELHFDLRTAQTQPE